MAGSLQAYRGKYELNSKRFLILKVQTKTRMLILNFELQLMDTRVELIEIDSRVAECSAESN